MASKGHCGWGTGNPDDLIKRASLLRHDSVHGEFGEP